MRCVAVGLLVLSVSGCASAPSKRKDDPNWRPTSRPVDETRDSRQPQWEPAELGSDLIDDKDVKPEAKAKDPTVKKDKVEKSKADEPKGDKPAPKEEVSKDEATQKDAPEDEAAKGKDSDPKKGD